ncbi:NUDIX domain-containing protein [Metabacillus niabensis]|uniref:NUDIX domain-containing protein n=1 Tax=Metabacillus niabensis TaxID=324854 RepID=UPI001CFA40B0|nr:NUDIX hydrolase [Metabacillus niabensis]
MGHSKRGNVWLAVSGIVENENGEWLVVKKKYGGLKGLWSLPAGFVEQGETIDEAVLREIKEETGITATVNGVAGIRSGVIEDRISDNMIIFSLTAITKDIIIQDKELEEVIFMLPEELVLNRDSSNLIKDLANRNIKPELIKYDHFHPGNQFGYSSYTLFL